MRRSRLLILYVVAVVFAACGTQAPQIAPGPSNGPTAAAGLFTEAQSTRGDALFASRCGSCHATREFSGRIFMIGWETRSVGEFYEFIRTAMPYDQPGSLSDQEYADVTAYVVSLNGFPAGSQELAPGADTLNEIPFGSAP
ncbi:MAG: hypothetical protein GEU90_20905 [Gemmatimonas sp.]|nr:hypothetical protein [Gemmatimonas sp.]